MEHPSIFFDDTGINDFPIEYYKNYTVYISPKCYKRENKTLIKKLIIYGIKYIDISSNNFNNIDNPDIYVYSLKDDNYEINKWPTIYFSTEKSIMTKYCTSCQKVIKEISNEDLKPNNLICDENCKKYLGNELLDIEDDLIKISKEDLKNLMKNEKIYKKNTLGIESNIYLQKSSPKAEKLQQAVNKQSKRAIYSEKRELYKSFMKQSANRSELLSRTSAISTTSSSKSSKKSTDDNLCQAKTKKGTKCLHKALPGHNYCGIKGHSKLVNDKNPDFVR